MKDDKFSLWCQEATKLIRFSEDRKPVYDELMAHLQDRQQAFMEQGMETMAAQDTALQAMGSAQKIAPELAKVHRPFWGYAYWITKVCAILCCALAIYMVVGIYGSMIHGIATYKADPTTLHPGDGGQWEMITQVSSEETVYSDGYWIRVPGAILWEHRTGELQLEFKLQVIHSPFLEHLNCTSHFWAVDSLGNHYSCYYDVQASDVPHVAIGGGKSTSGCQFHSMSIQHVSSADIQWIDLHYNRDGRDIVLRIDLAGGEKP